MFLQRTGECQACDGQRPQMPVMQGPQGPTGATGATGTDGWEPSYALVNATSVAEDNTGSRAILKFVAWVGGTGTPPAAPTAPNLYLGSSGLTTVALANNLRPTTVTLRDSGWVDLVFKTNYPHADSNNKPQFRIVGNQIYFRNYLRIAPLTVGGTAHQDSVSTNPTYVALSGNNSREAIRFYSAGTATANLPIGTTVPDLNGGPNITVTLANNVIVNKSILRRSVETTLNNRVGVTAYTNTILVLTTGDIVVSTILDSEYSDTYGDTTGVDHNRIASSKIGNGEHVLDLGTYKLSNVANSTKTFTSSLFGSDTYKFDMDTADARYLGGFNIDLTNTFGFLT